MATVTTSQWDATRFFERNSWGEKEVCWAMRMRCCGRWSIPLIICFWVFLLVKKTNGFSKVRGVNLGGWLVVEGWIKPSLFDGIPNGDMLDGTQVQFMSVTLQKFVSAADGGGSKVTVDRDVALAWETFKLWRISETKYQFRCSGGEFLTSNGGGSIFATADSPNEAEAFYIERNQTRVHLKLSTTSYIQAKTGNQLTADYQGQPGWDDNAATFEMIILANNLHGDHQLANGYGHDKVRNILTDHRNTFITKDDFGFLSQHGINTVRIPVGWWIAQDPNPPPPFIGGTLTALDRAFSWAQLYDLKCIIDLHAAPGSQNGMEHSASRDGSADWAMSPEYITRSLDTIDFLASRYANHPALLAIELLNEPSTSAVPLDVLVFYYAKGYQIVRKYSSTVYVIVCQRIGSADPLELYLANVGSSKVVVDLHYYDLFDSFFSNMTAADNIQFVYKSREPQIQALNNADGPLLFIGEWVNDWSMSNGTRMDYQEYGKAQLQIYNEASFGWAYWTLKCAKVHWDLEWNIRNNDLFLGAASSKDVSRSLLFFGLIRAYLYWHYLTRS